MKYIFSLLLWGALVVSMTSCGTINTIHFDQLKAGEVSFPEVIKRVGIINNMPTIEGEIQYADFTIAAKTIEFEDMYDNM